MQTIQVTQEKQAPGSPNQARKFARPFQTLFFLHLLITVEP